MAASPTTCVRGPPNYRFRLIWISPLEELIASLVAIFAIGLLVGFVLGYGVRAFISYRRHQAARRRRYIQ